MNPYDFYISPLEYEEAEGNGIVARVLEVRIRSLAWSKERAINTPPQTKNKRKEWAYVAQSNGIAYGTFLRRINYYGWSAEDAASKPLLDRKTNILIALKAQRKYPLEMVELARQNGIKYMTFRKRVKSGWNLIDAATTKPMTHSEIGSLTKDSWKNYF
ncbi:MAG: hypothetical protein WD469_12255 [Paenibacillaceae bacterium]